MPANDLRSHQTSLNAPQRDRSSIESIPARPFDFINEPLSPPLSAFSPGGMERLPFELLEYIAHCLSLEPEPQLRQTSLSYLSRTNKTLYLAAQPVLYCDPVLLSDWRAKIYEKTLGNKVDPWLLSRSSKVDKQWWMPKSLKFDFPEPPPECSSPSWYRGQSLDLEFYYPSARPIPSSLSCRHDFVWSNLTSFEISYHARDADFSPHLFGPGKDARKILQSLIIHGDPFSHYYPFLFDAIHFIVPCQFLAEAVKKGIDWPTYYDADEGLEGWEKHQEVRCDKEAWEWEDAGPKLLEKARFDYGLWDEHLDYDVWYDLDIDSLPAQIHSRPPSPYPFSSLIHLAMKCDTPLDCSLVFYTSSFPRLQTLSLSSEPGFGPGNELEWATLRFSITREKGVGINYAADNDDASILKPLSENEMLEYPLKPYRGPNLRRLELSLT
ncbi:uncharacterized protein JCM6883_001317 [Sporobolomyces salmoneus]|uniref:uncharacterized protein n=1 Tax=Sporobolomyces salmoneus TaxID=183962 RepID=UPI0031757151